MIRLGGGQTNGNGGETKCMWKKIKFSILIKYYCFFFMDGGSLRTEPRDNGALKFSEELPLSILATSLYQVHINYPCVLSASKTGPVP